MTCCAVYPGKVTPFAVHRKISNCCAASARRNAIKAANPKSLSAVSQRVVAANKHLPSVLGNIMK